MSSHLSVCIILLGGNIFETAKDVAGTPTAVIRVAVAGQRATILLNGDISLRELRPNLRNISD